MSQTIRWVAEARDTVYSSIAMLLGFYASPFNGPAGEKEEWAAVAGVLLALIGGFMGGAKLTLLLALDPALLPVTMVVTAIVILVIWFLFVCLLMAALMFFWTATAPKGSRPKNQD